MLAGSLISGKAQIVFLAAQEVKECLAEHRNIVVLGIAYQRGAGDVSVGLTIAKDGAIWVADDRNATILRIAADQP